MRRRTPDRRSPNRHSRLAGCRSARRGVAAIDYMLVLGVILPLAVFLYHYGPKIMNLVYDMIGALTAWPFP
jgi:hypothetical protein